MMKPETTCYVDKNGCFIMVIKTKGVFFSTCEYIYNGVEFTYDDYKEITRQYPQYVQRPHSNELD